MYDPSIGRFITEDPIGFDGNDTNLYRYVDDSPVNGTDPAGLAQQPTSAAPSREAQELIDLFKKYPGLLQYLEKIAKGTTKVERGGFILVRVKGTGSLYKIIEEIPKTPKVNEICLRAWGEKPGQKWKGALLPKCPSGESIDVSKLPAKVSMDTTYEIKFWWHTHVTGWVTGPDGLPMTGEPYPSEADLKDAGIVGLMVKYDEVTKKLRIFILERNGTFLEFDPKTITETSK
jgi:hypothetical protein